MSPKDFLFHSHNISGWHGNAKTFRDIVCKKITHFDGHNLGKCKAKCLTNQQCTAFNFVTEAESKTDPKQSVCVLKNCPLPIVAPTGEDNPAYRGYYQTGIYFHRISMAKYQMIQPLSLIALILIINIFSLAGKQNFI